MTILKAPKMLGRKGSMDRRPLARRRSSGFDRYSSKNHSSNGGAQWCCSGRACGMIVMAALVGVMLCSPLRLGSNMVLSVSVSCYVSLMVSYLYKECSARDTAGGVSSLKPFSEAPKIKQLRTSMYLFGSCHSAKGAILDYTAGSLRTLAHNQYIHQFNPTAVVIILLCK